MQTVELKEFAQHLPDYLARVRSGETLLVLDQQQPVAEIKPVTPGTAARPFGLCRGEFVVPDDFDKPLPEERLRDFEG
jgi:antitoxin (DNA-binding transcriptional repressor) of toxin-antitoxin stability system